MKKKFLSFETHSGFNKPKHYRIKLSIRKFIENYKNNLYDEDGDIHNLMKLDDDILINKINNELTSDGFNFKLEKDSFIKIIFHPDFQRNYIVDGEKFYEWRCDLIDSVCNQEPINPVSLGIIVDESGNMIKDILVVIDGQQRLITICDFVAYCDKVFYDAYFNGCKHENCKFTDLPIEYQNRILDYEFDVNLCVGTEESIHRYFEKINKPTFVLNDMELICSIYTNKFVEDAKHKLSVPSTNVKKKGTFLSENSQYCILNYADDKSLKTEDKGVERLQALKKALSWASFYESAIINGEEIAKLSSENSLIKLYLSNHKKDENAEILFETVKKMIDFFRNICCFGKDNELKNTIFSKFDNKIGLVNFYLEYCKYDFTDEQKTNITNRAWELINQQGSSRGWHDKPYIFEWSIRYELFGREAAVEYIKKINALSGFTEATKENVFIACGGKCPIDGSVLVKGDVEYHHIISRFCGGTSEEINCIPLTSDMHRQYHANGGYINGKFYSSVDLLQKKNELMAKEMNNACKNYDRKNGF